MMRNINKHLSDYKKSKELYDLGVRPKITAGDFCYDIATHKCYQILEIPEDLSAKYFVYDNEEVGVIGINESRFIRAYLASEIAEMIPDFSIPLKFEEGWILLSSENEAMITDDGFYETEVTARISYLIFFIKYKMIKVENIKI